MDIGNPPLFNIFNPPLFDPITGAPLVDFGSFQFPTLTTFPTEFTGLGGLGLQPSTSATMFFDTQTGQTLSLGQIQADPQLSQAFQVDRAPGRNQPGMVLPGGNLLNNPGGPLNFGQPPGSSSTGLPTFSPSTLNPFSPDANAQTFITDLLLGGTLGGGLAGILQALRGGGQTSRTVITPPPPTPEGTAAQERALANLTAGGQFAFGGGMGGLGGVGGFPGGLSGAPGALPGGAQGGLAGLLQSQQPFLNAAFLQALQLQANQIQNNPFLGMGVGGGQLQGRPSGQLLPGTMPGTPPQQQGSGGFGGGFGGGLNFGGQVMEGGSTQPWPPRGGGAGPIYPDLSSVTSGTKEAGTPALPAGAINIGHLVYDTQRGGFTDPTTGQHFADWPGQLDRVFPTPGGSSLGSGESGITSGIKGGIESARDPMLPASGGGPFIPTRNAFTPQDSGSPPINFNRLIYDTQRGGFTDPTTGQHFADWPGQLDRAIPSPLNTGRFIGDAMGGGAPRIPGNQTPPSLLQFLANQTQNLGNQQAGLLGQAGQNALSFQPSAATPAILSQILGGLQNPLQSNTISQQMLGRVPGLSGQLTQPGVIQALQGQGLDMQRGNLPPLNPNLLQLINQIYAGGEASIQSQADQALQGALQQARSQGFAGGLEQFSQGTPGALLAPALQTATRERAALEGQRAQSILGLMQGLPLEGGQLATTAGNLAQQNLGAQQGNIALGLQGGANLFGQSLQAAQLQQALQSLGLQGAQQQFGQQQGVNQNLLNTAQAFQNPFASMLQGGTNLTGLNQNVINTLLQTNQQGLQSQNQFLQALTGQTGAAGSLFNAFQPGGQTFATTQPFSLLNAFAPTASLLGGVGGLLSALGRMNQPTFSFNPGGVSLG